MLKRAPMIGFAVGVALATLHAETAEAGWTYVRPPGMWWYYGSVDGCALIGQVRNPEQHPALLRCDIQLSRIETLCYNPNNNDVRPGEAATKVVVFNTIDPEDLLDQKGQKNKGKANLCVEVDELSLPAEILCVNRNWIPQAALTTEFLAACTTEQCTGVDDPTTLDVNEACNTTVPQDTQRCACRLPDGFSAEFPPVQCADPRNPDPSCTAYICDELDANGQPTGQSCKLQ